MDEMDLEELLNESQVVIEETRGKVYHFYISKEIGEADKYVRMIHTLKKASPNDLVYIHLNTFGGYLHTTIQIVLAIGQCRGTVITCAEGMVASGGSVIFFAGNGMEVGEFSSFMLHDAQGLWWGGMQEQASRIKHDQKILSDLYTKVYGPFLTKKELKSVLAGGELWMDAATVNDRIAAAMKKAKRQNK